MHTNTDDHDSNVRRVFETLTPRERTMLLCGSIPQAVEHHVQQSDTPRTTMQAFMALAIECSDGAACA